MAYVSVADWKPEHVTEWLKGLDAVILPYIHSFVNNEVDGQQLLSLRPDDLQHRGITKVGHQEIILEAVEHLRNFHYELDRENIQLHALRLSCQAHSLHRVLSSEEEVTVSPGGSKVQSVTTQTLADVAGVIACIKPLALWLDRPPFSSLPIYQKLRTQLLAHGLNIATCAQRDRFAENPVDDIREHCQQLAKLADQVIQDYNDPLILQPASLDLATIKKRAGDDVGFYLTPSLSGAHQIIEVKLQGPAHQSGKVEEGDEIVQVNYQTVVGWRLKAVWPLLQEASTQVYLTLKKRPRHSNVYGQIYIKPFRLPSRKRNPPFLRWHENLPSPRPELLTIPHFELPLPTTRLERTLVPDIVASSESSGTSDEDDSAFLPGGNEGEAATSSPCSVRLLLPRPRSAVQRRATVSGSSPTAKHPPPGLEQLWAEIEREMHRRGLPTPKQQDEPAELRGKSGSAMSLAIRPNTVLGSESDNRSPLSPVPSNLRSKVYQTSSSPARSCPKPKPPPINTRPLPQSPPITDPYVIPSHSLSPLKTTQSYNVPTHEAPKLSSPPLTVPTHCAPKLVPSPTTRAPNSSIHTLDILPSTSNYMSSATYPMPVIVIEDDGMGDTLHERAIDCSPVPPPRPASSLRSQKPPQVSTSRNIVSRTMSRTKHKLSPRVDRKKGNSLLNKGRNVSVKQLGEVECNGWLLQRARAAAGASWNRAWFVLKDTALYGFPSPEAKKADKLISMPGFTAAAAPEVKSRQFAFKVYHTGTAFYFAAGCAEESSRWLGCLSAATLGVRTDTNTPYFSETEDEEQQPTRPPPRAASSGNVSGDHETKGEERRFGSLRRLAGSWRNDEGATSLDRKYIPRLLRQEAAVPVPTAQFRSYRRVDRTGVKESVGLDPSRTRTLPSRLGSQHQQRVMSVDSVANAGSTSSLPLQQIQMLQRDSMGSSPHLATVHEPASPLPADKPPRRILKLFSPGLSRKFGGGTKPSEAACPSPPPTLLGSPKLHRALFRGRRQSPQSSKAIVAQQPRRIPPTLPEDSAPPVPVVELVPDYPGLEYPPVFEPGTYTLNPESREQFHRSSLNTRPPRTNRTLMLLPKPKDACWPTQNLTHPRQQQQRRIRLEPPEGQAPRRPPGQPEVVLISSLDLLSSTDV